MTRPSTSLAQELPPEIPSVRDQLRRLVEAGRVEEARRLLREEQAKGTAAHALGAWPELLAMPKAVARPRTGREDFLENMPWTRDHRAAHRGEWVALRSGALVDSDKSYRALHDRLVGAGLAREVFIVKIDEEQRGSGGAWRGSRRPRGALASAAFRLMRALPARRSSSVGGEMAQLLEDEAGESIEIAAMATRLGILRGRLHRLMPVLG